MARPIIEVTIQDAEVRAMLTRLAAAGQNLAPLMANLAGELETQTEQNFANQSYGRNKWADLKPSTIASRKERNRWPGQILQISGGLIRSITVVSGADFAQIGANTPYAAIHQFGGVTRPHRIEPKNKKALAFGGKVFNGVNHPGSMIPARPYLPMDRMGNLQPEAQRAILRQCQKWLAAAAT